MVFKSLSSKSSWILGLKVKPFSPFFTKSIALPQRSDTITGIPYTRASFTKKPNGSNKLGKTATSAKAYLAGTSCHSQEGKKKTLSIFLSATKRFRVSFSVPSPLKIRPQSLDFSSFAQISAKAFINNSRFFILTNLPVKIKLYLGKSRAFFAFILFKKAS